MRNKSKNRLNSSFPRVDTMDQGSSSICFLRRCVEYSEPFFFPLFSKLVCTCLHLTQSSRFCYSRITQSLGSTMATWQWVVHKWTAIWCVLISVRIWSNISSFYSFAAFFFLPTPKMLENLRAVCIIHLWIACGKILWRIAIGYWAQNFVKNWEGRLFFLPKNLPSHIWIAFLT